MSFIFLSHSSVDNAHALALGQWLEDNGWSEYFLDISAERGLKAGGKWQDELRKASHRCEAVVLVVSRPWNRSKWCLAEFLLAKQLGKRIFGVLIEDVAISELPTELTGEWQLCDLVNGESRASFEVAHDPLVPSTEIELSEAGLDALRRGLKAAGLEATTFPWPPENDAERAPYRGLKPYTAVDAAVFFGRDAAIVRGLDQVRRLRDQGSERMLVILGSSGAGKSSYMRAGLWPRLQRDDHHFHTLPVVRPGRAAISGAEGLAVSLAVAFETAGVRATNVGDLRSRMLSDLRGRALADCLLELREHLVANAPVGTPEPTFILPVDQAEELYARDGGHEAERLRTQLAVIAAGSAGPGTSRAVPRVLLLVTIRTDLYTELQGDELLRDVGRQMIDLTPMDRSEYKNIIEGPARQASEAGNALQLEPQLTEQLLADTEGADALPMLAFTLERLYTDFGADGELTLEEYRKLGGITGSLVAAIEHAMSSPEREPVIPSDPVGRQRLLRKAFIPWLAEVDEQTGERRRRVALWSELPAETYPILKRLTEARLLVRDLRSGDTDDVQREVVEIAHEALLRRWPDLVSWLDADEHALKTLTGLSRAAEQWELNGRNDEYVIHAGERLHEAGSLLVREDFSHRLGESGAEYLAACRAAENAASRERQRRQRFLKGALAVSVAAGIWAAFSYLSANEARMEAQESAAAAIEEKDRSARALSLMHANLSKQRTDKGYAIQGALLALEALPESLDNPERPYVVEAEIALYEALASLQTKQVFSGHDKAVVSAVFSPDGKRVATASRDGTARLWDVSTGREIERLDHDSTVSRVTFSPNGAWLVTLAENGFAQLWDGRRGYPRARLGVEGRPIDSVVFSPDGSSVVTTSGHFVHVWKVASGCVKATIRYDDEARGVAFSRDGGMAATVSAIGRVHLWDDVPDNSTGCVGGTDAQPTSARWDTPTTGSSTTETGADVVAVRFSADGSRILSIAKDRAARLWKTGDLEDGPLLEIRDVAGATFSPDGGQLLIATTGGSVQLVSAAEPRPGRSGRRSLAIPAGQPSAFDAAVFSQDGGRLVTMSGSNRARVWNVATGRELAVLEGHWQPIRSVSFSPDGASVVTASLDGEARVHSVRGVVNTIVLSGHESAVNTAVFSHDDEQLLTASADSTARLWNIDTAREVVRFEGHHNIVVSAAFDPRGTRVVTASDDGTARVWDKASAQTLAILDGDGYGFTGAAFSPDGERVVTSSWDGTARVWDVPADALSTGENRPVTLEPTEARIFQHGAAVTGALFTRDGKRLVTSSVDCTARLWDLQMVDEEIRRFEGHGMSVLSAVPDADGAALVTASLDGTVRVWDMASGRERLQFKGSESGFNRAEFDSDGKRLVTASDIDGARLWDAKNDSVIDETREPPSLEISDNCSRSGRDAEGGVSSGSVSEAGSGGDVSIAGRMSTGTTIAKLVIEATEEGGPCDIRSSCPADEEGDACEHRQRCQVDANHVSFSQDGSKVVVSADDNTVYLWDVLNREELIRSALAHLPRRDLTDEERVRFHVAGDY